MPRSSKNLCLWCEFQSPQLFIISLQLKNVLTALPLLILHNQPGLTKFERCEQNATDAMVHVLTL